MIQIIFCLDQQEYEELFLGSTMVYNMGLCGFFESKIWDDRSSLYCMAKCLFVLLLKMSIIPTTRCTDSQK